MTKNGRDRYCWEYYALAALCILYFPYSPFSYAIAIALLERGL